VVWITGLSASGKSTLGKNIYEELQRFDIDTVRLDGEEVRSRLDKEYGFSTAERNPVVQRIADFAASELRDGKLVIVSTISHVEEAREMAREKLSELGVFFEVYLDCPPEECARRDPKGHWKRALNGEYDNFIGVTEPYQQSVNPEITLDTVDSSPEEATNELLEGLMPEVITVPPVKKTSNENV
jgi:bifunctional enzyme CysN/CysC